MWMIHLVGTYDTQICWSVICQELVLTLDSWYKWNKAILHPPQESGGGWRKDEARILMRVSALCSLQWFDTDGWVAGRTSLPWKSLIPFNSRRFSSRKDGEWSEWNQWIQVHLEKWPLNRSMQLSSNFKKVKASHTLYQVLVPELIPVYRQSAHRWL